VGLGLQGGLDGPASEFAGAGDGQGLDLGQDLPIGGLIGGLLELAGQQEGLLNDQGFQGSVGLEGAGLHGNLLAKIPLTIMAQLQNYQELFLLPINLPCPQRHEHTPACHLYGFHDLRRAFARLKAPKLTPDALQALMRHKSYLTTQVYVNVARQLDDAVDVLHVPDFLKRKDA